MRINFVLPPDGPYGGIRVVAIYAHRLAMRGHHVTVVQPRHGRVSWRETFRSVRHGRGWPKDLNRQPSYFDTLQHANLRRVVLPHDGKVSPEEVPDGDVVMATWWETAEWVAALPASKGAKAYFVQDHELWGGDPARVEATYRSSLAKIVIAGWLETVLREKYGSATAAVIGNSVDTDLFRAEKRGKQAVPTVGFVYAPRANKGADVAAAAIALARRELPHLRVIAFSTSVPDWKLLPPGTQFERLPKQERLRELYSQCDAWLFPSREEGFGLPILEAMACRTPVIASRAGGAPDILARGGGTLVAIDDPAAMAAEIVAVARMDDAAWRAVSDRAYATAAGYTWDDATDRMEAALRTIAESPKKATNR